MLTTPEGGPVAAGATLRFLTSAGTSSRPPSTHLSSLIASLVAVGEAVIAAVGIPWWPADAPTVTPHPLRYGGRVLVVPSLYAMRAGSGSRRRSGGPRQLRPPQVGWSIPSPCSAMASTTLGSPLRPTTRISSLATARSSGSGLRPPPSPPPDNGISFFSSWHFNIADRPSGLVHDFRR
ncbi:hypothetical protein SAY86_016795 [Trapa natans]|uniref:Uncharacterized protein n=1 Tax=Trapa natans TaxID=22666 RepID=A0AAN7LN86_TRANT|nr:hypothetical protein SAY86_016795 [Trapa natans]